MSAGASIAKIIDHTFANKKIDTLKFWGKAIEKTKFFTESGLAVTAITQDDINTQGTSPESTSDIANILTTIPGIKVALIISQIKPDSIKGSLRAEKSSNINVSKIAQTLGAQQPVQAYVVANNVTTAQALDRNIIQNASMG